MDTPEATAEPRKPKQARKNLTPNTKTSLICMLQGSSEVKKSGKVVLPKEIESAAMEHFGVSKGQVRHLWNAGKSVDLGDADQFKELIKNLTNNRKGKSGRKMIQLDYDKIKGIPKNKRGSIMSLAVQLTEHKPDCDRGVQCECKPLKGHSAASLFRKFQAGLLQRVSSAVKPLLTFSNEVARVYWVLLFIFIDYTNGVPFEPKISPMYDFIHLGEKWFYITLVDRRYYLCLDEQLPHRVVQHKSHIQKLMFLAAVARPRFSVNPSEVFDGKIGMWGFFEEVPAKRSSKKRAAGTLELKCVNVNKARYREMLIEKVLPAIREKWPTGNQFPIKLQHDNSRAHIEVNDSQFLEQAMRDGYVISIEPQCPNSPDTNILDLGLFRAIQSKQHENTANTMEQLRDNVLNAFWGMHPYYLEKVFLSLQLCMIEILKTKGSNNYKLPHMGKNKIFRQQNQLPKSLSVPFDVYQEAVSFRDTNAGVLGHHIPEQRLDLLGPESDDDDDSTEITNDTSYIEL